MYFINADYEVIGFSPDGTIKLRNLETEKIIDRRVYVNLNDGKLKVESPEVHRRPI